MEKNVENVKAAQEKFGELIQSEFERIERMKADNEVTDFDKLREDRDRRAPGRRHWPDHHEAGTSRIK